MSSGTPKSFSRRATLATLSMMTVSGASSLAIPRHMLAQDREKFNLDEDVPRTFGIWKEYRLNSGVVNPETDALIKRTYSQVLSRAYRSDNGDVIMIALAYGSDQSDHSTQLHYPEVCYPAQGFQIESIQAGTLSAQQPIPVKRLKTHLGKDRPEGVTYWTSLGNHIFHDGWSKKTAEIRHSLRGEIPDGMLTRISSIGSDWTHQFKIQADFAKELIESCPIKVKKIMIGEEK